MSEIQIFTIGFAKKNAEEFFEKLRKAGVKRIIDVRLNNVSQLAAFTKKDDLSFFLRKILDCDYVHKPEWAPTKDLLDAYKNKQINWDGYIKLFNPLITNRQIEQSIKREELDKSCLLCSEPMPDQCHRRLVAEYFSKVLGNIEISHL